MNTTHSDDGPLVGTAAFFSSPNVIAPSVAKNVKEEDDDGIPAPSIYYNCRGKVKVWTLSKDGSTTVQSYEKHDFIQIPIGVPHIFEFVEDTCMAEWWEPQGFQAWFYKPYREIVDKSFSSMTEKQCLSTTEHGMVLLVPHVESNVRRNRVFMMFGAFFIGIAGYTLGCKKAGTMK